MKTIAIDFDGVIHAYTKGWQDGSVYDNEIEGVFEVIQSLFQQGYTVFIFSTRNPRQIKRWLKQKVYDSEYIVDGHGDPSDYSYPKYGFTVSVIPFWKKFWNKKNCLGITKRKLPAECYIDDRAIRFSGNWNNTLTEIKNFKTYQQ